MKEGIFYDNVFVIALGVGLVFIGLICIILLCKIVSAVCMMAEKKGETQTVTHVSAVASAPTPIENRQEIIAAVSACVAEELGTDISAIRVLSFKKI